jgi:hypothetical protein
MRNLSSKTYLSIRNETWNRQKFVIPKAVYLEKSWLMICIMFSVYNYLRLVGAKFVVFEKNVCSQTVFKREFLFDFFIIHFLHTLICSYIWWVLSELDSYCMSVIISAQPVLWSSHYQCFNETLPAFLWLPAKGTSNIKLLTSNIMSGVWVQFSCGYCF